MLCSVQLKMMRFLSRAIVENNVKQTAETKTDKLRENQIFAILRKTTLYFLSILEISAQHTTKKIIEFCIKALENSLTAVQTKEPWLTEN
jgi:hypothetical protein